jgi:hypothetical protein
LQGEVLEKPPASIYSGQAKHRENLGELAGTILRRLRGVLHFPEYTPGREGTQAKIAGFFYGLKCGFAIIQRPLFTHAANPFSALSMAGRSAKSSI